MPRSSETLENSPRPLHELVAEVASSIRDTWSDVRIRAEISGCTVAGSGHAYLTLKDDRSQLRAVAWRAVADRYRDLLRDGTEVVVRGSLTVYEARGALQLTITSVQPLGEGALRRAFEALKARLGAEGLFDERRKRPLPPYPRTIGIVTSASGAVIRDVLTILGRRYPVAHAVIADVRVQGEGAADEIAAAIRRFNRLDDGDPRRPDVLIVGRGGGSLEDLWAFNEEIVARAVHASGIPVVSAVGHETDVTLCDLAADLRAGTPSMAAELVAPSVPEMLSSLRLRTDQAASRLERLVDRARRRLDALRRSHEYHSPMRRIERLSQRTDELQLRLDRRIAHHLERAGARLRALSSHLAALEPLRPLRNGFAVVERNGRVVRRAASVEPGDALRLRFEDGTVDATADRRRSPGNR